MDRMAIYNRLPVPLQNLACDMQGRNIRMERYGGTYPEIYNGYQIRSDWSAKDLCGFRDMQLRHIVGHSYRNVPYYHRLFDECGLDPSTVKTIDDLSALPVLDKATVNSCPQDFLARGYRERDLLREHTSGSTGSSFSFYVTRDHKHHQWATWRRYFESHGLTQATWCANFGSSVIVPKSQKRPPYWRVSHPLKQLLFSAFHGTDEVFADYYEAIESYHVPWIHGYPTCLTPFAAYLRREGLSFSHRILAVTTGGENIYGYQRKLLSEVFGAPVYSHYGMSEGVANFSEHEAGCYEVDEDFAATEFLPSDAHDGYRIVGTTLWNYAMPLIRYEVNDIATDVFVDSEGRRCVRSIDGRSGELIYLPDGSTVGALSALFTETSSISEAQIHQGADFALTISFVSEGEGWETDIERARQKLNDRVGDHVKVNFVRVEHVPRAANGKVRYVTSDVGSAPTETM